MPPGTGQRPQPNPPLPEFKPDMLALFLDVDGTLLEFAAVPDAVRVPDGLPQLLGVLRDRLGGALALISGRSIADMDRLFAPEVFACAGGHGLEHRAADGAIAPGVEHPRMAPSRAAMAAFAGARKGVLLEDKGFALALHYRSAVHAGAEARALAARLAAESGGELQALNGNHVAELKPAHTDKGRAIRAFMDEPAFAGRVPVFVGDDVTDEDGFAAVNAMGGHSIRTNSGSGPTAACHTLAGPAAVRNWLAGLEEALGAG